jgi:TolB-like protein
MRSDIRMSTPHLIPGQVVGHFRLIEEIGAGGMGVVYRAWDTRLERDVALKVLNPHRITDSSARRRFRREALILGKLNHPNVESVYDFHAEDGVDYLVLEYVSGTSLDKRLEGGPLPEAEVLSIGIQLARGLVAAHAKNILHRDLKPGNLRIGNDNTLKILDFGLAQLFVGDGHSIDETITMQSPLAGTPPYLAPEQIEGKEPDVRSDIYSAGVVLYELATGSRPFAHHGPLLLEAIRKSSPPQPRSSNKSLSRHLEAVIMKCLDKDPKVRYQSANELLADLEELALASGPHRPVGLVFQPWWMRRRWIAALLALVIVAGLGYAFRDKILGWVGVARRPVSIAVLPLQNHTGDPKLDYLGAGMSEALTGDLSRVADLQVTAHEIARRYGGDNIDIKGVGQALHVSSIVGGSISMQDDKVRIPISLIDTSSGRQIWGQTYEGSLSQIPDLQHQISTDVAYRLKVKSDANMQARLKRQYSTNPKAYDFYLKGRFHLGQRSPEALQNAISDFQRALDHDSQYAPAYAGLADCYSLLAYYGIEEPIPLFRKALGYSQQALELDSTLGEAYTSRAVASIFLNFDWQGAESDYKRALELNPNYLTAHNWYALSLLIPLGRRTEAAAQLAYAQAADPNSMVTAFTVATLSYLSGDPEKAIQILEPRRSAQFEPIIDLLSMAYLAKNMPEKAAALLEGSSLPADLVRKRAPLLGIAYAKMAQKPKALDELRIATDAVKDGQFLSYGTAALYTVLDDHPKALEMLELAYARRESNVVFLNVDPFLAPLHSEAGFQKLLQQMNML